MRFMFIISGHFMLTHGGFIVYHLIPWTVYPQQESPIHFLKQINFLSFLMKIRKKHY